MEGFLPSGFEEPKSRWRRFEPFGLNSYNGLSSIPSRRPRFISPCTSRFFLRIMKYKVGKLTVPTTGKTPPRLINDLLDYDPRTQFRRNLLADPAPIFKKDHFVLRKGELDCRHSLMKKEHRTTAPFSNDEQPNGQKYVIAAYCTNCRFHFDITADFSIRPDFQNPCRLSDEGSPMHHLRLVESMYAEDKHDLDKYNEFTESHRWACSGPTCPLVLEMKITPPRLKPKMLSQITNADKVDARGRKVIAAEPERYAGYNPLTPLMVLGNLRSYLADAKAARDKSELKRIAKRNKRFGLGFADDCDSIFNYLDFTQIKEEGSEIDVSVLFSGVLYAFCE